MFLSFFSSVLLPQILKFKLTEDNSLIKGALFKFPANATDFSLKTILVVCSEAIGSKLFK